MSKGDSESLWLCRLNKDRSETSNKNQQKTEQKLLLEKEVPHEQLSIKSNEQSLLTKILKNPISLHQKNEVESLDENQSTNSEQMDIDQQNDIVNQLSFIQTLKKDDQENELFANFSIKDRILYANSKKHQGNQFFKENNLEQAIQSYKIALSLLKPESFQQASQSDYLLMAELTSNILHNMGTCYFILMSFRHAIKFYDQAILIKPNYIKAIHNRALCHFQEGNLSKAYEDIKMANNIDQKCTTIQNDLKKIQIQYRKRYQTGTMGQRSILGDSYEKNILSKSMVQNECKNRTHRFLTQTTSSMISCRKSPEKQSKKSTYNSMIPRKKFQYFQNKKCSINYLKSQKIVKTRKHQKSQNGKTKKFRPYVLNKSVNFFFKDEPQSTNEKKISSQGSIKSLKRRVKTENSESLKDSTDKNDRQKYWGYIPIFVATGFGIYHSIRAVLGK